MLQNEVVAGLSITRNANAKAPTAGKPGAETHAARLMTDENFPAPAVEALRRLGHDVLTLQGLGHAGLAMADEQVLALAVGEGRALVTLNRRHFIRLHQLDQRHAGIIVCSVDPDFQALARRIHDRLASEGDLAGRLLRVNRLPTG